MDDLKYKFKNILIIEDDESLCQIYADFFKDENIQVDVAHTLKDAEKLLNQNKYDLSIVDWNLRGQSATVLLSSPHFQTYIQGPVLIITGYSDHEDFDREIVEKYNVLYKPFSLEIFKNILQEIV